MTDGLPVLLLPYTVVVDAAGATNAAAVGVATIAPTWVCGHRADALPVLLLSSRERHDDPPTSTTRIMFWCASSMCRVAVAGWLNQPSKKVKN